MKAWVYQDSKQVKKVGPDAASWYVGWLDPDGKRKCQSCGPGPTGKRIAQRLRDKTAAELLTGTYEDVSRKTWAEFREEYADKILPGLDHENRRLTVQALDHFEAIVRPGKVATISTATIDTFIATRRTQRGKLPGSTISRATVNKELRHLRAALRKAAKWDWLPKMPDFAFLREPEKLPTYISPDDFAKLYAACDQARVPRGLLCPPADWWRGLIVMAYMTGWRIGQLLALRREDVDLAAGTALTRAEDNKGGRDQRVKLHPAIVEHLKGLRGFDPLVFPWRLTSRPLYDEFLRLQILAKIKPEGGKRRYGFHDLRRAFATMNADRLTADALQKLMQHKSYLTTKKYINMTRQLDEAVDALHVPDVLKAKKRA